MEGIPEIQRGAARTLSEQIADWLRQRIRAGDYRPEIDPLPSEQQLMKWFSVSRDTARRVHEMLRDEGLVYTVPQRGTFVIAATVQITKTAKGKTVFRPRNGNGNGSGGKSGASDASRRGDRGVMRRGLRADWPLADQRTTSRYERTGMRDSVWVSFGKRSHLTDWNVIAGY